MYLPAPSGGYSSEQNGNGIPASASPPELGRLCVECEDAPPRVGQLCIACNDRIEERGRVAEAALRAVRERAHARRRNYRIIDEFGRECWAGELAQRYRAETEPKPMLPMWQFR